MFCPKCGCENEKDARFCVKCGAKLARETVPSPVPPVKPLPPVRETNEKQSPLVYVAIVMAVLAAVAVLIAVAFFVRSRNNTNTPESTVESQNPESQSSPTPTATPSPTLSPTPSPTLSPTPSPTPTATPATGSRTDADYVFANSDTVYLTESDLTGLTAWELKVARNEIYARRGRIFNSADLVQYFNSKSWYRPLIPADQFDDSYLNAVEKANAEFIRNYEKQHNINQ